MLSKPDSGWSTVSIGEFEAEAGYLVDIPFDWLNACLVYNLQIHRFYGHYKSCDRRHKIVF